MNLYSHANREKSCKWTNRYPPLSTWLEATPRWNFRKFLLKKKKKPETQIQMAKHDKISGAFWEITYVGIMLLREQDSTLQRTIFWCSCIALMSRDKRKRALMYFMRLPSMISGTSQRQGENFCIRGGLPQGIAAEVRTQAAQRFNRWFIMFVPGVHTCALKNIQRCHGHSAEYKKSQESQKNRKKARDYLGCARKLNSGTIVERNLEDEQYHMRMYEQGYSQSDVESIWQNGEWDMDFRRAFVRKSVLPKLVQRRTTPSRRRQRYHQGQRTPWIRTSCTVVKGKHDQTSLRTRRYTVAIVDFTDRHGDSPNDLPHLMSQQLVLITNETTPAQGACCGTTQFVWLLWFFLNSFFELTVGEWLSHALFQSSFTQTHMWRTPHIKKLS